MLQGYLFGDISVAPKDPEIKGKQFGTEVWEPKSEVNQKVRSGRFALIATETWGLIKRSFTGDDP